MKTETQPIEIPTEFTIDSITIKNMYQSFVEITEPKFISDESIIKGYKLAVEISFNNFKIYFKRELEALNLSTDLS